MLGLNLVPLCCFLLGVAASEAPTMHFSGHVISGRSLPEVYGDVKPVTRMEPRYKESQTKRKLPEAFLRHRSPAVCDFPIELVIVQDATESFADDIVNMKTTQLQLMVNALAETHPGSAFSLVSFRDKPLWPLGEIGDYCVRFGSPLTPNLTTIVDAYSKLTISGGGDPPEAQFTSLIAASQSSTPGWGSIPLATRLMVVVTDAAPHFEGDGFNVYNLPAYSGTFDESNNDQQCIQQYYPSPITVRSAIAARGAYLASLIYDGSYDSGLPIESWQWFNAYLGQTAGFVHDIEVDSSNFWARLSKIIEELENVECGISPTTPPPPATSVAATTAAPSTAMTQMITTPAVKPTTIPTIATTAALPTTSEQVVTPVGTAQSTLDLTGTCPPCKPCNVPEGCPPCCREGVLIQLKYRPAKLHLEVEN